ncbi:helix-turn-helix transcriptional regulator [Amycolatopsis sp. NPDC051061]|uniref:helix-turn-helix domain-containing protein n=1 Tax=Amycolatopsis sp. NPDC051061 TaxID=3155042 RepID=UPI003446C9D8
MEYVTTVKSRELGEGLRRVLAAAGLSGKEVADQLGWTPPDVSKMLNGRRAIRETQVALLLGICKVRGAEQRRLLALCREANRPGWYQQHGSHLPLQLRTLLDHEDKATAISAFAGNLLPGALQTADYARAVISRIVNVPAEEVDERVAARVARSAIFNRPAGFTYFVHEFVLRLPVGGAEVMSDQLHHLLRMSVRPRISLRVVPTSVGAHAGIVGSFIFMEFAEIKPVVYLESETTAAFLEEDEEIRAYRRIIGSLAGTALSEGQSRELISRVALEQFDLGEDQHG